MPNLDNWPAYLLLVAAAFFGWPYVRAALPPLPSLGDLAARLRPTAAASAKQVEAGGATCAQAARLLYDSAIAGGMKPADARQRLGDLLSQAVLPLPATAPATESEAAA